MLLLSRRPDVRMAEQALAAAYYATAASRPAFYPAVTLSGSVGWTNAAGSQIVNPGKMLATAVASLTQPIFQRGALLARHKIARAQQEESALAFRQTLLTARQSLLSAQLSQVATQTARIQGVIALYQALGGE